MFKVSKKLVLSAIVTIALLFVIINIVTNIFSSDSTEYISGGSDELSYSDVREYLKKVDFNDEKNKDFFKGNLVNKYTLKFFKFLQETFKEMNYDQHIEAVRKYLNNSMDSESAEKFLDLYKKFLEYEKRIAAEINTLKDLKTTEDFLGVLQKMRKMQIEMFGEQNADIIFGASLKSQEYPIRRAGIINDTSLYGKEKEEQIRKLNSEMWGTEGDELEKNRKPYTQYTEKIDAYSKDLGEMSENDKIQKIKQFREEVFSPDIVQRLEEVDNLMESEKQKELTYMSALSEISNNKDLSEKEKQDMIYKLQNNTFGEDADSFRRRQEMEAGKQNLINQYKSE